MRQDYIATPEVKIEIESASPETRFKVEFGCVRHTAYEPLITEPNKRLARKYCGKYFSTSNNVLADLNIQQINELIEGGEVNFIFVVRRSVA